MTKDIFLNAFSHKGFGVLRKLRKFLVSEEIPARICCHCSNQSAEDNLMTNHLNRFIFSIIALWLCCSDIALAKQTVVHRVGAGQIRIEQGHTDTTSPLVTVPPVVTPPVTEPPVTPPPIIINPPLTPPPPPQAYEQLELILRLIPSDTLPDGKPRLGIYYDPSKPFTVTNPVRIYNREKGGYYSVYFDKDDYLQISVGAVPNNLNNLRPLDPNERIDINNLSFKDSAVLNVQYGRRDTKNFVISENESLTLDVLPRARTRYGTVTTTFSFNDIYIPAGSIVVGTRDEGLENVSRPELKDMENLRFYSPDGVLINIIGNNDKPNINCGKATKAECFDFQQFYEPEGATEFGARIFASYNPRDLFPGKSAEQANKLWLDMQKDLESNMLLNINTGKEPWNERLLKDLNEQEKVYIMNQAANMTDLEYMVKVLGYQLRTSLNLKDPNAIKAVCERDLTLRNTDDRDSALNKAYDDMFCKLSGFSKAKIAKWIAEDNLEFAKTSSEKNTKQRDLNDLIDKQQTAKTSFDKANLTYIDELKNGAAKRKPVVVITPPAPVTPPVVDEDEGLDMPTKCSKPKNKSLKVCRPYYDPPADCINKKGNLKNTAECEGYKEPTPIPQPPPVVVPPPPPVVTPPPKPTPPPAPTPPKKKK